MKINNKILLAGDIVEHINLKMFRMTQKRKKFTNNYNNNNIYLKMLFQVEKEYLKAQSELSEWLIVTLQDCQIQVFTLNR